jgi:HK97 family phage prohead protease
MDIERRAAQSLDGADENKLVGYAAVFDKPSEGLPGFTEIVRPGAFSRSLQEGRDVIAVVHHDMRQVLGRRSAGTMRLEEDSKGLRFEIDLPDTTVGRDTGVSVKRGDLRGASFAFTVPENGDRWTFEDRSIQRELLDVDLYDITITATPIYQDTQVAKRAMDRLAQPVSIMLAKRYLEALE